MPALLHCAMDDDIIPDLSPVESSQGIALPAEGLTNQKQAFLTEMWAGLGAQKQAC